MSFETSALRDCYERFETAEQLLGEISAMAFAALIAEIEAFENASEMLALLAGEVEITDRDSLSVLIGSKYRGEFSAVGTRFGRNQDGKIDWATVMRLKLLQILPT